MVNCFANKSEFVFKNMSHECLRQYCWTNRKVKWNDKLKGEKEGKG